MENRILTPPVDPLARRAHTGSSDPYFWPNCLFENSKARKKRYYCPLLLSFEKIETCIESERKCLVRNLDRDKDSYPA